MQLLYIQCHMTALEVAMSAIKLLIFDLLAIQHMKLMILCLFGVSGTVLCNTKKAH